MVWVAFLALLRAYSQLCIQGSLLVWYRELFGGMRIKFESGIHKCFTQCIITADLILKVILCLLCLQHQRIFCTHDETAYKLDIVMSHTTQNLIAQATIIPITPCLHLLRLGGG